MPQKYTTVQLGEIEPITVAGSLRWRPLRRTLGVEAFGINAYIAASPGDAVVEEHTEVGLGHEEVYVVLSGRATFSLDEEQLDAPAGTVVFVRDPAVKRAAHAEEADTAVLAVGGKAGQAYAPSAWEWYFAAERFRGTKDYDGALAILADGLERFPDHGGMVYSAACWESLAGRHDEALEHVARAFELDPRCREWARTDADLDAIRNLPGYPAG